MVSSRLPGIWLAIGLEGEMKKMANLLIWGDVYLRSRCWDLLAFFFYFHSSVGNQVALAPRLTHILV